MLRTLQSRGFQENHGMATLERLSDNAVVICRGELVLNAVAAGERARPLRRKQEPCDGERGACSHLAPCAAVAPAGCESIQ